MALIPQNNALKHEKGLENEPSPLPRAATSTTSALTALILFHGSRAWSSVAFVFNSPLYLQSVPAHSANVVKSSTKPCRRVLTSTLIYLIGSESSCDLGSETYELNLKNYIYS
jgi:hypothetical protein